MFPFQKTYMQCIEARENRYSDVNFVNSEDEFLNETLLGLATTRPVKANLEYG